MFALAFDVAVEMGGDLPVVFGAEHMVALLNRHQRFDEAMRGEEHSGGRGEEAQEEEETLDSVLGREGGSRQRGREGGRTISSSINFQMSVAKNSLPPPPSSLTNNRRAALCAHRRCHAEICAAADIGECTSPGRAPPVALAEPTAARGHVAEHDVARLLCQLHRHSVSVTLSCSHQ